MSKATVTVGGVSNEMTYKYGADGIRIEQKINSTEAHTYLVDPNNPTGYAQVLQEFIGTTLAKTFAIGHDVLSQYDHGSSDGSHPHPAATSVWVIRRRGCLSVGNISALISNRVLRPL